MQLDGKLQDHQQTPKAGVAEIVVPQFTKLTFHLESL
jgi:hypothetical protein